MRVFLDTNVLVSAFATRGLCADILHTILAQHELIIGQTVLDELAAVLRRKFKVPEATIVETDEFLKREGVLVPTQPLPDLSISDPSDLPILAEALASGAGYLITGDRGLRAADPHVPIDIVSPREFWEALRTEE